MVEREQERPAGELRRRLVLQEVELGQVSGFVIPRHRRSPVPFRGDGNVDYSCGRCSRLLAIGVRAGSFGTVLLACECGAFNRVPNDSRARAVGGRSKPHVAGLAGDQ